MAQVSNYNVTDMAAIRLGKTRREVNDTFKEIMDVIAEELASGNEVVLNGFLKFELVEKDARTARNPRTGETVEVPAKTVVKVRNRKRLHEFKDVEYTQLPEEVFAEIKEYREKRGI